jgi:hypothetical protein
MRYRTGLRAWIVVSCGLVAALGSAAPAAAHPAGVQAAVDFRTTVTGVVPAVPGLEVRFLPDGSALWLRNRTGVEVRVLGYQGEPWWRIGPDGVFENMVAPSRFADRPAEAAAADAKAEPQWHRVSAGSTARWRDHRSVWHGSPPEAVTADRGADHRLRDWAVPIDVGGRPARIVGTLDWVAPPRVDVWVLLILAGIAVVGVVGTARRWGERVSRPTVAGALALAGLLASGYLVTVAAYAAGPGVPAFTGQLAAHPLALLTGAGALAAAYAVARHGRTADIIAALAGLFVAVVVGVEHATVFAHAVAPVPADGGWARLTVALAIAGGAGAATAGLLRMRQTPVPVTAPGPARPSSRSRAIQGPDR